MSDRELTQLIDRAVHHAPQMHLSGDDMLAAGKGRVRRRRAVGAGGVLGAVALVAALWGGLAGGDGSLLGTTSIQPASTVWEPGQTVDATLFEGFQTIDADHVGHSYAGHLSRQVANGPVMLTLSDGADVVEEIPAQSPVPGLELFAGERMTVALWVEPDGVVTSVPLVGPVDPGGPTGRSQGPEISGERTAYAVWSADVVGVTVPDTVRDVYLVGRDEVVALSGADVESEVLETRDARVLAWSDGQAGVWGYAVDGQEGMLEQLGGRPAQFASYSGVEGGVETSLTVLPEGSGEPFGLTAPDTSRDREQRRATLGGRTVVLATATVGDDPAGHVVPTFRLGGTGYTLDAYSQDLFTLDTPGGRTLSVEPGLDGSLVLRDESGAQPLVIQPEDLTSAPTAWPTALGTVVVAVGWAPDGTVLDAGRVGLLDGDPEAEPRWVEPADVAQVRTTSGEVTLMSLDLPAGSTVVTVGVSRDGEVERWQPPLADGPSFDRVTWNEVDGELVPALDGQELARVEGLELGVARLYRGPSGTTGEDLLVLPAGLDGADVVLPLLGKGGALDPAPWLLGQSTVVPAEAGAARVVAVPRGMLESGSRLALRAAAAVEEGSANVWSLLGAASSAHFVLDPGIVVTVGGDAWLAYRQGDTAAGEVPRAGLVGRTLTEVPRVDDPSRHDLVAVLPAGSTPELVLGPGGELHASTTHDGPAGAMQVWTAEVTVSDGVAPADAVRGLDLDGDGEPGLRLPYRG